VTLLELLVVLAIIAFVAMMIVNVTRRVTDSELREKAVEVVALMRQAYSLSAQTGVHHRVFLDLEQQKVRVESCPETVKLKKTDDEEEIKKELLKELADRPQTGTDLPELRDAETPEKALAAAAALQGVRIGGARCELAKGKSSDARGRGFERDLSKGSVKIRRVHAQHLRDPVQKGNATVNFFPLGYAEKAVVELSDEDGDVAYVVVSRLTGRIELKMGDFNPKDYMRKNASGQDVREDR
jgi:intracellular sulfur oxidation DsrE/DsrF family protein